jgi:hypothetical protein
VHNFLDNEQLGKSANAASICDELVTGVMQSVTTGPVPSESSFKGGSPVDDDMVKTKELMPSGTTAFGLLSVKFHTGGKAQQAMSLNSFNLTVSPATPFNNPGFTPSPSPLVI